MASLSNFTPERESLPTFQRHFTQFKPALLKAISHAERYPNFECYVYSIWKPIFDVFAHRFHDKDGELSLEVEAQWAFLKGQDPDALTASGRQRCIPDFAGLLSDDTPAKRLLFFAEVKPLLEDFWFSEEARLAASAIILSTLTPQIAVQNHFAKQFFLGSKSSEKWWFAFVICGVWWSLVYYDQRCIEASAYKGKQDQADSVAGRLPKKRKRDEDSKEHVASNPNSPDSFDDLNTFDTTANAWSPPHPQILFDTECIFHGNSFKDLKPSHQNFVLNEALFEAFSMIVDTQVDLKAFFQEVPWFPLVDVTGWKSKNLSSEQSQ
ncbi:hypothetical protein K438DRAFT_1874084 [Mycena galopus ATCC 62051]|nr:hypothetical protein K438DRAFT_1874084 [Mycena galopus ATCC 62051]